MKACVRNSDNVVLFLGDDLVLDSAGLRSDRFKAPIIKASEYTLVDVTNPPADWIGGGYSYSAGIWIKQQLLIDKEAEEVKKEGKNELEDLNLETAEWFIKFLQFYINREGISEAQIPQGLKDYKDKIQDALNKRDS